MLILNKHIASGLKLKNLLTYASKELHHFYIIYSRSFSFFIHFHNSHYVGVNSISVKYNRITKDLSDLITDNLENDLFYSLPCFKMSVIRINYKI